MNENVIKLWELVKWCSEGAYVGGEYFKSDRGKLVWFDGKKLHGLQEIGLNESLEYLGDNK